MTTPGMGVGGGPLLPVRPSGRPGGDGTGIVRAVAPVRPTVDPLLPDLSRAGVDLPALLDRGADALVARDQPGSVALAELLERARGALVRGAPMELLAALDAGWDAAARTESGWYFRAAALILLGLPGEAERVLQQAASLRDRTAALAFLQSVVRSAVGDAAGARLALADALTQRPTEPLLHAWNAVVSARGGHVESAHAMLTAIQSGGHSDPVIAWARQAILRASANEQRAVRVADSTVPFTAASPPATAPVTDPAAVSVPLLDPIDAALDRLGARLGVASHEDLEVDVRQLMQSLSASGAMQEAGRSERSHAVRAVLATLLQLLGGAASSVGGRAVPGGQPVPDVRWGPHMGSALDAYADAEGSWRFTPVGVRGVAPDAFAVAPGAEPTVRRAVLEALRAGRREDAEQWLGQARAREGEGVVRVLRRLIEGAAASDRVAIDLGGVEATPAPGLSATRDDSLLSPLRFGLILLQEIAPRREARVSRASPGADGAVLATGAVSREDAPSAGRGEPGSAARRMRRAVGVGCLLLAALALLVGNGTVAMVLAGGAVWLLLR